MAEIANSISLPKTNRCPAQALKSSRLWLEPHHVRPQELQMIANMVTKGTIMSIKTRRNCN